MNAVPLFLGKFSKDFLANNMKKIGLYGYVYNFSVDYDSNNIADILAIHKYLMVKNVNNVK